MCWGVLAGLRQATHWKSNNSDPQKCYEVISSRRGPPATDHSQHISLECFCCCPDWVSTRFRMANSVLTRHRGHRVLLRARGSATTALGVLSTSFSPCSHNDGASEPQRSGSAASPLCLHSFRGKGKQDPLKQEPAFSHWFPPRVVFFISLVQLKGY